MKLHKRQARYSGKLFPNGEFCYGWDSASYKHESHQSKQHERAYDAQYYPVVIKDEDGQIVHTEHIMLEQGIREGIIKQSDETDAQRLILSLPQSLHKSPKRRKRGITGDARRKLRNAVWLMEKEYGTKNLTFATITIPPLPQEVRKYLNLSWGEFKRKVIQEITRRLKRAGSPPYVVEVTEVNTGRYAKYGDLYLHSHLVWANNRTSVPSKRKKENEYRRGRGNTWAIDIEWLRSMVLRLLINHIEAGEILEMLGREKFSVAEILLPRIEVARVRKTVAGYLAKYLSKSMKGLADMIEESPSLEEELPWQWYYLGGGIRKLVLAAIRPIDTVQADCINCITKSTEDSKKYLVWCFPIILQMSDEFAFLAGQLGKLTSEGLSLISALYTAYTGSGF